MNDPILIQVGDEVREATPEEAADLAELREKAVQLPSFEFPVES